MNEVLASVITSMRLYKSTLSHKALFLVKFHRFTFELTYSADSCFSLGDPWFNMNSYFEKLIFSTFFFFKKSQEFLIEGGHIKYYLFLLQSFIHFEGRFLLVLSSVFSSPLCFQQHLTVLVSSNPRLPQEQQWNKNRQS